jgi:hypothetical protein
MVSMCWSQGGNGKQAVPLLQAAAPILYKAACSRNSESQAAEMAALGAEGVSTACYICKSVMSILFQCITKVCDMGCGKRCPMMRTPVGPLASCHNAQYMLTSHLTCRMVSMSAGARSAIARSPHVAAAR